MCKRASRALPWKLHRTFWTCSHHFCGFITDSDIPDATRVRLESGTVKFTIRVFTPQKVIGGRPNNLLKLSLIHSPTIRSETSGSFIRAKKIICWMLSRTKVPLDCPDLNFQIFGSFTSWAEPVNFPENADGESTWSTFSTRCQTGDIVKVDGEIQKPSSVIIPGSNWSFLCVSAHGPYIQIIEEPKQVRLRLHFLSLSVQRPELLLLVWLKQTDQMWKHPQIILYVAPQGSSSGPLWLFSTSAIRLVTNQLCVRLYADDTIFYSNEFRANRIAGFDDTRCLWVI